MDGINIFDIFAIAIVVGSCLLAFSRGFVREAMSILGWIFAAIAAYIFAPAASTFLDKVPLLGDLVRGSCELAIVASFAIVFAIALLLCSLATILISTLAKLPILNLFDRSLGLLFGAFRGILVLAVFLIINDTVIPAGSVYDTVSASKSAEILKETNKRILEEMPTDPPDWLVHSYDNLMATCSVT